MITARRETHFAYHWPPTMSSKRPGARRDVGRTARRTPVRTEAHSWHRIIIATALLIGERHFGMLKFVVRKCEFAPPPPGYVVVHK